jgi:glycine hydroxymethyltransferase
VYGVRVYMGEKSFVCVDDMQIMTESTLDPMVLAEEAKRIVREEEDWRAKKTLNLIASENVMSPVARALYNSDFQHRYAEGEVGERYYEGVRYADDIEALCERSLSQLVRVDYVNVKPLSGAQANLAVFFAFAKPGDHVMSVDLPSGGHISYREFGAAGCRGLVVDNIPYNSESLGFELELLRSKLRELRGKLTIVTLGGSLFLFPHPVRDIARILEEEGMRSEVVLHYDAAHVFGLVVGGKFQDPVAEGADVISSSTHKTFPGPQGGVLLGARLTDKQKSSLRKAVFPGLVSNHHLHRLPALAYTIAEMARFGHDYASQVVSNAKRLAKALDESGFRVLGKEKGYTESHQVALDVQPYGGGAPVSLALAQADIITNKNLLPGENPRNSRTPAGIRLGVQELTRLGMNEAEMERIAELFTQVVINRENPESVRHAVHALRSEFTEVRYTFVS